MTQQTKAQLTEWDNKAYMQAIANLTAERDQLRQANEAFAKRQDWWNEKMVELEAERDQLRAQVEQLQGGEAVAAVLGDIVALWDQYAPSEHMSALHMQAKRALAGQQPVSPDMHGWCAYVGGMVAHWVKSEPDAITRIGDERFEAAITGIIERRLWAMPKAAPPAAPALVVWQPIETAPKDGTEIVLRRDNRVTSGIWIDERWPVAAEYHSSTGEYLGQFETGECVEAFWYSVDGGFTAEDPPTHWMPLPPPPVGTDGVEGVV